MLHVFDLELLKAKLIVKVFNSENYLRIKLYIEDTIDYICIKVR